MSKKQKKICVAMSGGVDSSVAAYLLKEERWEVIGVTMCLGVKLDEREAACCGEAAIRDARSVCDFLDIPHYVIDFSKELYEYVIKDFITQYREGKTPNPCVKCNKHLKFSSLLNYALSCGCEGLATGHYTKIGIYNGKKVLMKHHDTKRDQSYFLYSISPSVLDHIIFPLEKYTKEEVRRIAKEVKLPVAEKKESREICFVPDDNYRNFLKKMGVEDRCGNFVDKNGEIIGIHKGIFNYTIGQRKGLGITTGKPSYVISIDSHRNTVTIGNKEDVMSRGLIAKEINIFTRDIFPLSCSAKTRYTQKEKECRANLSGDTLEVIFTDPVEAITPGQSVVLYKEDIVIGGGIIDNVF
ncbi:MAG: tRNA 2-thiouridine(34) synthase MnmA [Chitinispirillaceae bacterium]|nr:tRNA 2-thiouridine(34) synthase MnmA [Chitinispirillaceae bacterium]